MALGTWWQGDHLPRLAPLAGFSACKVSDTKLITTITKSSEAEIERRFTQGNSFYVAYLNEEPVAYGWLGTQGGRIYELHFAFELPERNYYLWDFVTLPQWRGRGIYARLLQEILQQEAQFADRFWILYEPDNVIAGKSIRKAGFCFVGELLIQEHRVCGIELLDQSERAYAGATVLGLPIVEKDRQGGR